MTSTPELSRELVEARAAFDERRWATAFDLLSAADAERSLDADDLERLGDAAWWVGRLPRAIEVRQRAFQAYKAAANPQAAARTALHLVSHHANRLEGAIAAGWLRRAERLLAELPESSEHADLGREHLSSALDRGDLGEALRIADSNLEIAERLSDVDVEAVGLQDRARVLIAMGRVDEGMVMLNEAVVAAVSGEVSAYPSAVVYCNATIACEDLTDYRRASEFAEAANRWCESEDITGFPGLCRVRRVEIIHLKGDWQTAEQEARKACAELQDFSLPYAGEGFYQIGEIRLRLGDLDGAEEAYSQAHRMGRDPMPGLAMLRRSRGDVQGGRAMLVRALGEAKLTALDRARLLPAEVTLALDSGDVARGDLAATELERIAETFGTQWLRAQAAQARGSVALLQGDTDTAIDSLREAVRAWQATDAPWETAVARTLLGEAYLVADESGAAGLELEAAQSTFVELGAEPDTRRTQGLLDGSIAPRTRPAPPRPAQRTFMFTDIVRSTSLLEAIGDEAWTQLLAWHDAAIRRILADHDGKEVDHTGDGFFVAFQSADDALGCAITIRTTLGEHREQTGFAPDVRIGLHSTGALQTAEGYTGSGVHVAARIGSLAEGGQILVSREVIDSATDAPSHGEWREERLKGIVEPVPVTALD